MKSPKRYPYPISEDLPLHDGVKKFVTHLDLIEGRSPNTVKAYARDLVDFMEWLRDRAGLPSSAGCDRIMESDITGYLGFLGKGRPDEKNPRRKIEISARTLNRRLSALKAFFKFCMRNSLADSDPTANLSGRRQDKKLPVFLSYTEIVRLIESIPTGDLAGLRDRAIIECLYSTGIRVSELVSLSMGRIPKEGDSFRVIGKRRKERIVFIGEPAKNAIAAYLAVRRREGFDASDDSPLFMNSRGGRLTQRSIQRILSVRSQEAGLRVIPTPHSLRHSFATHLVGGGADLRTVQELLGHASLSTVQIYTHLAPKELIEKYLKSHPLAKEK